MARQRNCEDVEHPSNDLDLPTTHTPSSHVPHNAHHSVYAAPPQKIRLGGFRDIFSRYCNSLDNATCSFGTNDDVLCTCDTLTGTMECDVPKYPAYAHDDELVVRAKVAEYETPPLAIRYRVEGGGHNVLMRADSDSDEIEDDTWHITFLKKLTREDKRNKGSRTYALVHQMIAECLGTMFIVIFGVGSVCSAVLTGSVGDGSLWHIATVWGFGVALAILATNSVSGAHLNPAVSLAFALFRPKDFPKRKLLPYWFAQYLGGVLGGAFNLLIFGPAYKRFEELGGIVRGQPNSLVTASTFGEYFPAPGQTTSISPAFAMLVEAWGTGLLMFVILALTDPRQKVIHNKEMLPLYIGFTVAVLISLYAPLTQAGWNPARDFGPRLVAFMAGWGKMAIPGPNNGFWIYIIGPKIGAPLGALVYDLLINPGLTD